MNNLKPLLLSHVTCHKRELSRLGTVITISDIAQWDKFLEVLNGCNGEHTVEEIATLTRIEPATVISTVRDLEAAGFVWLLEDYRQIPTACFRAEFKRWLPVWVEEMYDQDVWEKLYAGHGSPGVMVGWAIENMHYTRTVIEHMTWAVVLAGGQIEQQLQFKHLSEEWDHCYLFWRSCIAAGIDESELSRAVPLPTTKAITHFMRTVAREGAIVYNACEALLEATTEDNDLVTDFYRTVGERFSLPNTFTQELVRHVRVDADFGHIDIFDHLLDRRSSIDRDTVCNIFECCSRLASLYSMWNSEIATYYSRFSRPMVQTY